MCMLVIGLSHVTHRPCSIVYVAVNMEISRDPHGPVIQELQGASRLMNKPEFSHFRGRRRLYRRKATPDDHTVLAIAFLRDHQNLIAGARRAGHSPAGPNPLRQDRKPAGQHTIGLQNHARRIRLGIDRGDNAVARVGPIAIQETGLEPYCRVHSIHERAPQAACRVVSRSPASDVYRPHVLDEPCARRETAFDGLNQVDLVEHGSRSAELNPLPRGQNGVTRHLQRDDLSMQLYLTQSLRRHEFRFLDRKIWACDDVALRGHTSSGCDSGLDRGVVGGNTCHGRLTFGAPALNLHLEGIRDRWEIFHLESTEHAWIDSEDDSGGERAGLEKQRPALNENLKILETRQRHQKIPLRRAGGIAAQGRASPVALIIPSDKPGCWGNGRSQAMTFRESLGNLAGTPIEVLLPQYRINEV